MLRTWTKRIPSIRWLLLLLTYGCGGETKGPDTGKGAPERNPGGATVTTDVNEQEPPLRNAYNPAAWPLSSHLNERCTDDLDGLADKRCIRVLTTFNKTYFFVSGSRIYGFDWRLIMAMAYQESRLNNSKKSHTGAVGIMQVPPRRQTRT